MVLACEYTCTQCHSLEFQCDMLFLAKVQGDWQTKAAVYVREIAAKLAAEPQVSPVQHSSRRKKRVTPSRRYQQAQDFDVDTSALPPLTRHATAPTSVSGSRASLPPNETSPQLSNGSINVQYYCLRAFAMYLSDIAVVFFSSIARLKHYHQRTRMNSKRVQSL